ncbi:dATP/dGTP diphosphohydrolase domain-containing protein [Dyella caseinilytica]|uniref:dATP/dGTP diphosphohydrolase N-terminal domain-containing protein n=1 Tax=Dyella caseinilytica TaxID=1849581 RepID=A0ABX7GPR2_9GAMM|nr:dATP/dGTP diphosphohydrolase domain-containing protein [Dyella caseinilytica]QRN52406.1 hypothetical protein ISN74_13060 [Dyella caseinilytica]GGA05711.1 hypothetical protein GCM10011408_28300 [Dyella caseinilytica]
MTGVKHDGGKAPWNLLPWDAVRCIVHILAFGARKYKERNWEQGMDWSRVFAGLHRHLASWWEGEKADPETGKSHLWHAGCCILFLIAYELRSKGRDDRPGSAEACAVDSAQSITHTIRLADGSPAPGIVAARVREHLDADLQRRADAELRELVNAEPVPMTDAEWRAHCERIGANVPDTPRRANVPDVPDLIRN